jgi:Na+/H+ antiporter NhaD/arsenite permease-like protein
MIPIEGAAVLLIISRVSLEKVLHEVDWAALLFFVGLSNGSVFISFIV